MRYVFAVVVCLLIGVGFYFNGSDTQVKTPAVPSKENNTSKAEEASQLAAKSKAELTPAVKVKLPGAQPPEEPNTMDTGLEDVIRPEAGFKHPNVNAALKALERLDPEKLTKEQIDALRWSLFESKANETVRNNTANVLLRAKDGLLAGALITQLNDQKQTPLWRNYCVQHLEAGYQNLKDKNPKVIEAIFQATTDPDKGVRDVCLLHLSRMAVAHDWKATNKNWYERVVELTGKYLDGEGREEIERVSAICAVGRLGLVSKANQLTALLSDTKSPLGVRKAAATALGHLAIHKNINKADRKIALNALDATRKDRNRLLRGAAETSLALVEKQNNSKR